MESTFWRKIKMNLEEAFEIVLNEAESVGLGESGDVQEKILNAVEVAQVFYDEHGHHFANFSVDNAEESVNVEV
tara:strand:- start:788 stop:1009 length:222 start_codon:yes stop_codon:yes gene_type:complete